MDLTTARKRHLAAWASVILAAVAGISGWFLINSLELGAAESIAEATAALTSVENSLRQSTDVASATADALDAAAVSVDGAAQSSDSVAEVAQDVSDVTATLPPVIESVSIGLQRVDNTVRAVEEILDSLPFDIGVTTDGLGSEIDPLLEVDPLLADLAEAEASLDQLAQDAAALARQSRQLATELRTVATELRDSVTEIEVLADDVASANQTLAGSETAEPVNLLAVKLVVLVLVLAVIVGQLPNLSTERAT